MHVKQKYGILVRLKVSKWNWKEESGMNGTKEGNKGARKSEGRKKGREKKK